MAKLEKRKSKALDESEEALQEAKADAISDAVCTAERRVHEHAEKTGSAKSVKYRDESLVERRQSFAGCKSLTAKMSLGSQWFQDREPSEMQKLLGLEEDKDACAGHLVDYLERSRAVEMRLLERTVSKDKASGSLEIGCSSKQQSLVNSMNKGFRENKSEVAFEKLQDQLMTTFIRFWRAQGKKEWAPKGVESLTKYVKEIVKGKQKKKCLSIDVDYYELRYKLTHAAAKGLEHQDERHDRLRDFFKQYHSSQSKVDLQMASSNGQLRLIQSNPEAAHKAFVKSLGKKQHREDDLAETPVMTGDSWKDDLGHPLAMSKVDTWKVRYAKGRPQRFGMDLSRTISRELSTMPSLPPTSPLGRRGPGSRSPSGGSPSLGGSATLTGGWGLDGRWPRDARRHQTAEALVRADQEPVDVTLRPRRAMSATLKPLDRQLRRADQAFRGVANASSKAQERPPSRGTSQGGSRPPSRGSLEKQGGGDMGHSRSAPTLSAPPGSDFGRRDAGSPPAGMPRKERNPFVSPWRESGGDRLASPESPTVKYLRESELNFVSPKLIPFITGHADGILARNQALNDCDLLVIGTMLAGKVDISEVDLGGNALLTERSLVPFLQKLFDQPIDKLNLSRCMRYALPPGIKETLNVVESLLSDPHGLKWLRFLDLSGITIGLRTQVPLCQAIQEHCRLTDVSLSDTGIGGSMAKECIGQLMSSSSIKALDVSWNSFNVEEFTQLGERLAGMGNLQSLSVANCSSSQTGLDNPAAYFIEHVGRNTQLTHLDVSGNRITFRGALVLEDAMECHKKLSELTISNNPLGILGCRCLLRLLSRDSSGLIRFTTDGLAGGTLLEALSENMQIFRASNPSGRYKLNLTRPYHRALLRMLYKTCDRFGIKTEDAFKIDHYTKGAYTHQPKDNEGIYAVPCQGTLSFVFNIVSAVEGPLKSLANEEFGAFVDKYQDLARIKVGFKKIVPMMAYWKSLEGRSADQIYMLEAMDKDFAFSWEQIEVMCRSRGIIADVLWRLMPSIIGGIPGCYVPTRGVINLGDFVNIYKKVFLLDVFNADNPTGHYKLDLENPSDFLVAEKIVLLDRWESSVARKLDRADISQLGNWSHCRNEKFQELPIQNVQSIMEWGMPEWDTLELDYVTSKRPPPNAVNLDESSWERVLVSTQQAGCSQAWQVQAFRKVSHHFYVSAIQARQLLLLFGALDVRSDIFIMIFMRITDIANEKVCRCRFDALVEVTKLRKRLGHLTMFPFIQPEQAYFEFDLSYHDQRLALTTLLQLALKERVSNVKDYEYRHSDGIRDDLPLGIPPSWAFFDKIEKSGTFKCTYICAPEDRKLQERKQLLEKFGFWIGPSSDDDVNWWASMAEAPEDVIEFLDFLVARYNNIYEAFVAIDGPDGNKNINLREFEEGLMLMKCKKFKGKHGKQNMERIHNVFRYLDPSGEGQVSESEWGVLELLFKEINLAIQEFAWFLNRTFEDLNAAWLFLDGDGSGALDFKEWKEASESIGYYGPTRPIFSYLDKDDEGTISMEEFQLLKDFV